MVVRAIAADVDWGPVAVWVGAAASFLAIIVALLGGLGFFARRQLPMLKLTFEQRQPWCRHVGDADAAKALWVRISVENRGVHPARGCVGRLLGLATDNEPRADVDPVQLRWAGVPRSHSFAPVDIRRGQHEYLNIVSRPSGADWLIGTFESTDFDPGFATGLRADQTHTLRIALFADNAETREITLRIEVVDDEPRITLVQANSR